MRHALNKMDPVNLVTGPLDTPDPEFGYQTGFDPFTNMTEEQRNDPSMPGELKKIFNTNEPELQNLFRPIVDAASREAYLDETELKSALFDAKWNWYKNKTYAQMKLTTEEVCKDRFFAEQYDEHIKPRVEFMYNYMDYETDRSKMRYKFLAEMHKKTSVKDIGEKLDEFILDSKAATAIAGRRRPSLMTG